MTVERIIEKVPRLLHSQVIFYPRQDWSHADVVSFLPYCGLIEFRRVD